MYMVMVKLILVKETCRSAAMDSMAGSKGGDVDVGDALPFGEDGVGL
jgi:hypothetical protein